MHCNVFVVLSLHSHCNSDGISLFLGGVEITETRHVDGCDRQCHFWYLLGRGLGDTLDGGSCLLQARSSVSCHCSLHDHV